MAPRGLAISAIFAEVALGHFNRLLRKTYGVHRYFRYADDIIVFSLPEVDILPLIKSELNKIGLRLNKKTEVSSVRAIGRLASSEPLPISKYTYLGYEIATHEKVSSFTSREFDISISEAKLNKRKTRLFLALHAFVKDSNTKLLIDRPNYLSTNQSVYKTRHTRGARKQKIRTGIHYNYSHCGHYPESKKGRLQQDHYAHELIAIDVVLQNALFNPRSEFSEMVKSLPANLQDELQQISFAQGFKRKLMKRFTRQRVGQICKVWGHE